MNDSGSIKGSTPLRLDQEMYFFSIQEPVKWCEMSWCSYIWGNNLFTWVAGLYVVVGHSLQIKDLLPFWVGAHEDLQNTWKSSLRYAHCPSAAPC